MLGVPQAPNYSIALNHTHSSALILHLVCYWLEGRYSLRREGAAWCGAVDYMRASLNESRVHGDTAELPCPSRCKRVGVSTRRLFHWY
jgi:hypothetical protein